MAHSASDTFTWTVSKLVSALEADSDAKLRIEIPKFQRHLVWSDDQKKQLIDSIQRGYPIGSILLYKRADPHGKADVYQVVDGLQRSSTLLAYSNAPLRYSSTKVIDGDVIDDLATALGSEPTHVARAVDDWMQQSEALDFMAMNSLTSALLARFSPGLASGDALNVAVATVLNRLKEAVNIDDVHVPVVIYSGPEGDLPEIFERINQQGTKLNKYEIYAATWLSESATLVTSENVRTAVVDKYNSLIEQGFTIDGVSEGKQLVDFNLFEYLFGFGKVLTQGHPYLFRAKSDPAETEPIAFSVVSTVCQLPMARLGELPRHVPRSADGLIVPTRLEEGILTASKAVEGWLRPFIGLKLNLSDGGIDIAHGELQIASLIARTFVGRWELDQAGDLLERPDWQADWKQLAIAVPQHYLMDIIEETWRGPLYSLLFNRVWTTDDNGRVIGPSRHYATAVPEASWDSVFASWYDKQLAREQRTRSHVRAAEKVFLRFTYTSLVSHLEENQQTFEIEHLYPVARLKKYIVEDEPGWPISCISNLALFTKSLNREKSAQTISEYVKAKDIDPTTVAMVEKYLLVPGDLVAIGDTFGLGDYRAFLDIRWDAMAKLVKSNLKISS